MTARRFSETLALDADGFNHGVRLGLPVMPGVIAFGLVVGAVAARQGFTFVDTWR